MTLRFAEGAMYNFVGWIPGSPIVGSLEDTDPVTTI